MTTFSGADLVVIASSTGGPVALKKVFAQFTTVLRAPLLVVQHMPAGFTSSMALSLDRECIMPVTEAAAGDVIHPGNVYIAPGGFHMVLAGSRISTCHIRLQESELVNGVRPAADVLFDSVARVYAGARVLAVVLTGMGSDGLEGVRSLKTHCKCCCLAQNEATSVVYGMPKSIVDAGLADEVLGIDKIAARIEQLA